MHVAYTYNVLALSDYDELLVRYNHLAREHEETKETLESLESGECFPQVNS